MPSWQINNFVQKGNWKYRIILFLLFPDEKSHQIKALNCVIETPHLPEAESFPRFKYMRTKPDRTMYKRANSCWMQTPSTQIQISVLTVTMATSNRVQSSFITSHSTISGFSDVLSAGSCNNLIRYGLILNLMNNLHLRHHWAIMIQSAF